MTNTGACQDMQAECKVVLNEEKEQENDVKMETHVEPEVDGEVEKV